MFFVMLYTKPTHLLEYMRINEEVTNNTFRDDNIKLVYTIFNDIFYRFVSNF